MKVDRRTLNFVTEVELLDGSTAHVHCAPLSMDVFERYFIVLTKTYAAMLEMGPVWLASSGQRSARLMLRAQAEALRVWEGPTGVAAGLVSEIRRLANVLVPSEEGGWSLVPLETAIKRGLFSELEAKEVESTVTFFTVCSASATRQQAQDFLGLLERHLTSSSVSAYRDSLPISTAAESTGAKATRSSIPV